MVDPSPTQIECLVCGAVRVVFETTREATGRCRKCGYAGWTFAADLEWSARELIAAREQARRSNATGPG